MKGFEFVSWYGLWGPKNLPPDVSAKLQSEIAKIMARPDMKERLSVLGLRADCVDIGAIRQIHRHRDGEVFQDHQGRQPKGRVISFARVSSPPARK